MKNRLVPSAIVLLTSAAFLFAQDEPVRHVHRMELRDRHVFELYDLTLGPNAKVFEIVCTRKKG